MPDNQKEIADRFLLDTAYHTMRVHKDDGLYRHLEFSHNGSSVFRYDLLTYPCGLLIRGDAGTFVFEREPDMFRFFDKGGKVHEINPSYWAQKVEAADRRSGIWEYDQESASEQVLEALQEWEEQEREDSCFNGEDVDLDDLEDRQEQRAEEVRAFLSTAYSEDLLRAGIDDVFEGPDWSEMDFKEYTNTFLWCLCAIVKGVHTYYTSKEKA